VAGAARAKASALALAAIGVIVLGLGSSPASALPGPSSLALGFDADTLVFDPGQPDTWFPRMRQIGSSWVRVPAAWDAIAPQKPSAGFHASDPGDHQYDWTYLDRALRAAAASRQDVLLQLIAPPAWALGRGAPGSAWPHTWRPDAHAFGDFARAVATRYTGRFPDQEQPGRTLPRIDHFQVWNEPNLPSHLGPQWKRVGRRWVPASPAIYRGLLNAAYENIKSVQPRAYVLAAGLGPYGDPPGVDRMRPVQFLRELLCLSGPRLRPEPCVAPARLDAIDIHPYALTPTLRAGNADDVSVPDVGKLSRVLRAARRTRRVLPRGSKAIWMTEISWDSSPPDGSGVPLLVQARYVSLTAYELWLEGVTSDFWYEPHDLSAQAGSFTGAGLFRSNGQAKPSATAFRFPFVTIGGPHRMVTLWGRAPRPGLVVIDIARHHRWQQSTRITTTDGGVFFARRRLGSHLTLRARAGTVASLPSSTG
jgi:hypothetical protein